MTNKGMSFFMKSGGIAAIAVLLILLHASFARAQTTYMASLDAFLVASNDAAAAQATEGEDQKPKFDIYGFAMLDTGYQGKQNDPNWFDVVRPTKLPAFENQFGEDGRWFAGVRQSRFGVKSYFPTELGELRTTFEFELFGTGVDQGQTTFRLRHAYGELGQFGAGQTWSPFMDIDVFPNSIEYWGPTGMVFFRNVQVRWMPIQGESRLTIAIERPGASADAGAIADRIELQDVRGRFPVPDISAEYRYGGNEWGYVEVAGIFRKMYIDDLNTDQFDLDQDLTGWGINLSSNLKFAKDTLRLQYVFGEGIQNYMNDAPVDVGAKANPGNAISPVEGEALPLQGLVIFLDHTWSDQWTSSFGYSRIDIDNSDLQNANAFKVGQYALGNLLYYPAKNVMMGGEFQWGRRENFADGFEVDDYRIQFSFKYNFSYSLGGE
ncbi:MAG TPA: DcaP family trimeric outer membrane transporter [Acidobacteriota bacterium]|nr:DcaP family trimeric outer membrane transporter [Acidobacteriota bacterium]